VTPGVRPGLDTDVAQLTGLPAGPSFHFVLNNRIYKDNRIPPRGFTNADFATFGGTPVGHTYADGQYWDEPPFTIPGGATRAEVRLYYQSTSKEYVEFLRDENTTNDRGQFLYDAWSANQKCPPELMASRTLTIVPPGRKGDLNCDGLVNFGDINPFVLALSDPDEYRRQFPNGDILNGDCNGHGALDVGDINPFVMLLGG
jgi:hypothetical protein